MSVFIIKVERKARRPRAELMLRGDSVQDSLRMSVRGGSSLSRRITAPLHLWRWVPLWCSCSTAGSCSPQVVVFAESVEQLLSYVLFGLCKIPSRSGETKSSPRTPRIGWKKLPSCVGEVGSGSAGEGNRTWGSWGGGGILHSQGSASPFPKAFQDIRFAAWPCPPRRPSCFSGVTSRILSFPFCHPTLSPSFTFLLCFSWSLFLPLLLSFFFSFLWAS